MTRENEIIAYVAAGIIALLWIAAWTLAGMLWPVSAYAHTAASTIKMPQGWKYSSMCCSGTDCAEIKSDRVKETPNGYVVTLRPEDHIMVVKETTFKIPYDSVKIKEAPDGVYHICLSKQMAMQDGTISGGNLYCFYVPPKGY